VPRHAITNSPIGKYHFEDHKSKSSYPMKTRRSTRAVEQAAIEKFESGFISPSGGTTTG
jgi:hypothetical protein